jgi:hypothetical protein
LGAEQSFGDDDGACDPCDLSRLEVRHETGPCECGGSSFWPVVIKTFLVRALVTPTS